MAVQSATVQIEPGALKEMEPNVIKYQYEEIIKHLLLLQDHAAARTCPYTPTGEMCIRKHLIAIEAYAEETIPIEDDPTYREKLERLETEARSYRLDQEAVLCGEKTQLLEGLDHWARKQRKEFELRALPCVLRPSGPAEGR
ncbi:MAG: hypothetical protein K6V36_08525 [Anaerolineae bacterium]|nr:hypothetical protein [Anaerolineae bacterium]